VMCSVLGSVLVIGGLYLLLWGKRQEALHCPPKDTTEDDKEQLLKSTVGSFADQPLSLLPINRRRRTPVRRSRSNGIGELVCAANDLAAFSVFSPFYYAKSTSKHAYN
jgi:hypothetical protein